MNLFEFQDREIDTNFKFVKLLMCSYLVAVGVVSIAVCRSRI
jgi:hypothetical protein